MMKIKNLIVGILVVCGAFVACDNTASWEPEVDGGADPSDSTEIDDGNTAAKDTAHFRVLAYIDKASVEGHLGSGEEQVREKMEEMFEDVTEFWNSVDGSEKLDYYYLYTLADMKVYEGSSQDSEFRQEVYDDPINFDKYDVTVLFDGIQDHDETGGGGAAAGGGSDDRTVITVLAGPDEKKNFFEDGTYGTLTHELGHYRGITDLYQYIIDEDDNPVNGEAFDISESIMGTGEAWDEYSVAVLNLSGDVKQIGKEFDDFFGDMYPDEIEFNIKVDGEAEEDAKINLYGSRAGGSNHGRDIVPEVFLSGKTDRNGQFVLENTKQYYVPDPAEYDLPDSLPYGRWFGFLAEIENLNGDKEYVWLPEHEVHMAYFENDGVYNVDVDF